MFSLEWPTVNFCFVLRFISKLFASWIWSINNTHCSEYVCSIRWKHSTANEDHSVFSISTNCLALQVFSEKVNSSLVSEAPRGNSPVSSLVTQSKNKECSLFVVLTQAECQFCLVYMKRNGNDFSGFLKVSSVEKTITDEQYVCADQIIHEMYDLTNYDLYTDSDFVSFITSSDSRRHSLAGVSDHGSFDTDSVLLSFWTLFQLHRSRTYLFLGQWILK